MIATNDEIFEALSKQFEELQSNLECFLSPQEDLSSQLISSSKVLYDSLEQNDVTKNNNLPKKLLTKGFDNEQIWQQLNLNNTGLLRNSKKFIGKIENDDISLMPGNDESIEEMQNGDSEYDDFESDAENSEEDIEESSDSKSVENEGEEVDEEDLENIEEFDEEENSKKIEAKKYNKSIVDDKFFKLRQLEEFLDQQDRLEELRRDANPDKDDGGEGSDEEDGDENIDMFAEMDDDDDLDEEDDQEENLMYNDFFDPPPQTKEDKSDHKKKAQAKPEKKTSKKTVSFDEDQVANEEEDEGKEKDESEEEMEGEMEETKKSVFERRQEEISKKISKLEEANVSAKPWQLLGETTSKTRPVNSLLEEHVTFDHTSVGTPVITEETTNTIEDIIKQRIRDQAWDDVERKVKPATEPHEYKRAPELNMEKSKLSLAQVYEKEYLKQMEDDKEEKENEDHVEIQKLMDKLFVKLDALSNFYFTPKPAKPDIKIITNTPSLQMEEVTPITMTSASQMAPEEVHEKKKGDVIGEGEKSTEDRKRERRQKKIKKKFAVKEREKKEALKAKTTGKTSKKKAVEQLKKGVRNTVLTEKSSVSSKGLTSSTQFFNKLQDEVSKKISAHKAKDEGPKRKKQKTQHLKL
ncbi:U3 small nucleolar ribonucleoprotein protein MPP10-like [Clytia hemisphaerica]|uniref:U3 small nucleolar ribonucleoprotein protein MPP10 n=1 Tax=Clytia hemisphaerica TaxID=252671 RepID=A0A7M5UQJ6_9CNID|eukprot:TCONS_00020299-protein